MTRLLAAALLLAATTAPAFACDYWNKSVSTDTQSNTVASQPSNDQATPPPSTSSDQAPS